MLLGNVYCTGINLDDHYIFILWANEPVLWPGEELPFLCDEKSYVWQTIIHAMKNGQR
jgi:hypothetical protein